MSNKFHFKIRILKYAILIFVWAILGVLSVHANEPQGVARFPSFDLSSKPKYQLDEPTLTPTPTELTLTPTPTEHPIPPNPNPDDDPTQFWVVTSIIVLLIITTVSIIIFNIYLRRDRTPDPEPDDSLKPRTESDDSLKPRTESDYSSKSRYTRSGADDDLIKALEGLPEDLRTDYRRMQHVYHSIVAKTQIQFVQLDTLIKRFTEEYPSETPEKIRQSITIIANRYPSLMLVEEGRYRDGNSIKLPKLPYDDSKK